MFALTLNRRMYEKGSGNTLELSKDKTIIVDSIIDESTLDPDRKIREWHLSQLKYVNYIDSEKTTHDSDVGAFAAAVINHGVNNIASTEYRPYYDTLKLTFMDGNELVVRAGIGYGKFFDKVAKFNTGNASTEVSLKKTPSMTERNLSDIEINQIVRNDIANTGWKLFFTVTMLVSAFLLVVASNPNWMINFYMMFYPGSTVEAIKNSSMLSVAYVAFSSTAYALPMIVGLPFVIAKGLMKKKKIMNKRSHEDG